MLWSPTTTCSPTIAQIDRGQHLVCWLLDTRSLWVAGDDETAFPAQAAEEALALLPLVEQNVVKRKTSTQDAKMSLASALLKRAFVSRALHVPWKEVRFARRGGDKYGKPCAVDLEGIPIAGIDFNVSHQNGLVALIGYNGRTGGRRRRCGTFDGLWNVGSPGESKHEEVRVGVDIVCVHERKDYRAIDSEGFDVWVDMFDRVFSEEERWSMKYDVDYIPLPDGTSLMPEEIGRFDRATRRHCPMVLAHLQERHLPLTTDLIIAAKLRRFYTYFCYKEAYVKLAGEGLLAPWLPRLEMLNVRSPKAARNSAAGKQVWGEEVGDVVVSLYDREVGGVSMNIRAFEKDFMVCTAVQGDIQGIEIPSFQLLDLERDVLPIRE